MQNNDLISILLYYREENIQMERLKYYTQMDYKKLVMQMGEYV